MDVVPVGRMDSMMSQRFCVLAFSIAIVVTGQVRAQTQQRYISEASPLPVNDLELSHEHFSDESAVYQLTDSESLELSTVGREGRAYSVEDFESFAFSSNPTIRQAQAQVAAAEGAAYQAGLLPNPVVGYTHETNNIGNGIDEHYNGGFVSQEIVTGGKLRLSRAKWCQRVQIARTNLQAQQQRVRNDVRIQYFRTLAAQDALRIQDSVLANGEDQLQTAREMLNLGQTNQSGLLNAEVALQRDRLARVRAQREYEHAWRTLTSYVGCPQLAVGPLEGNLSADATPMDWDTAWVELLGASPELRAARQRIDHDRITVQRERAEPIPNLLLGASSIYSPEVDTTTTTLNVGLALPVFDRNRGTVKQAMADLSQSHAEVQRLELELRTRLATQFRDYETSWQRVMDYETIMLPKAKQSYDMLHESYKNRRAAWPDVLMAQRQYLLLEAEQINNLLMYRENDVAVRGMLLSGGLMVPPPPVSGGHIDAVPKPR